MRSEQEMFDLIVGTAKADERVRAVYLNGSRANPRIEKDRYQDYDIVYVVTETGSFLANKDWISVFGEIAVLQEPYLNDLGYDETIDFHRTYAWLMLFKDWNRIDLTILTRAAALEEFGNDPLTVVLLDKDHFLPPIPAPTDEAYWVKKPTELQFNSCCNNFWWCLNNVAKGIARDELPYTLWMYNVVVRDMLVRMLEWYIGVQTGFCVSTGKAGKFFKRYLPRDIYEMYLKTYSGSQTNHLWAAIFQACELFRTIASPVSEHFGYAYNHSEEHQMTAYLLAVKNQESW